MVYVNNSGIKYAKNMILVSCKELSLSSSSNFHGCQDSFAMKKAVHKERENYHIPTYLLFIQHYKNPYNNIQFGGYYFQLIWH